MSVLPYQHQYQVTPMWDQNSILRRIIDSDLDEATKVKVMKLILGTPQATITTPTPRGGQTWPNTQGPTWTTTVNATDGMTQSELYAQARSVQDRLFDYDATGKLVDGVQTDANHSQGTYRGGVYTA